MGIDEINEIVKKASELKDKANSQVDFFEIYLEAQKLYDDAYENCILSTEISQIDKDFLSAIYRYESLDCQLAYALKKKDFNKCKELCAQQVSTIDNVLDKYKIENITEDKVKSRYKYLVDHKITAKSYAYFPMGIMYFEQKEFKKALFYFRRTEEIYNTRNLEDLQEDYLFNHYLNYYLLKFNISQCQVGILKTNIEEKEFLERQIIKELLQSVKYAIEVINISSDLIYKKGHEHINNLIKTILRESLNTWQNLFDYTQSHQILDLMIQVDPDKAKLINRGTQKRIDYLLFYTHGFNTRGEWKDDFTTVVTDKERNTNIHFILSPWDYGEFKLKFFQSKHRSEAIQKFVTHYKELLDTYGDCELKCIVAHSFGTYIVGTALQENPNFICDKIVLAGNILDPNYDWNILKDRKQIDRVLIEQCSNDRAVLLAKMYRKLCFQKWIGFAGRSGFNEKYKFMIIKNSNNGHSGMLTKKNMIDNWFPFLVN